MAYFEKVKKNFGFGCMRLPMKGDEVDYAEFSKMVDTFLEAGFNYFDTARGYMDGRSETALRKCLTSRYPRESYILTNKLTHGYFKTKEDIRPFFESQLEACGVDYFDFYLMHAQTAEYYRDFKECRAYETAFALKEEGKIRHVGISFLDRAEVLEQIRRAFVGPASHEMKTPLCLLQMYAENLKNNVSGIVKDYYCDTIIDEVGRLSDLVGGMLELSAIENGLAAMDMGPLDLGELCAGILDRMSPVLGRFQLIQAITPGCMVCGDAKFLGMAVENFLTNAVAHTLEGGKIKVTVESAEGAFCLTVSNQGPHIPPDRLERIWDSFYKVDEARVRTTGNHAGLGLAIVKNVVTRLGGTCQAGNTAEGMEFAFSLPAADNVE